MLAADDALPFWSTLLIGGLTIAAAIAMLVVVNRAAEGALGPNRVLGIRTAATRRSPEAWQAAHRAATPFVQLGGMALVATGPVVVWLGSTPGALLAVLLVGVALMLLAVVFGSIVGVRAAESLDDSP